MTKRFRIIFLLMFALLAGMLSLYVHHNREPSYQGRTLTRWLEVFHKASDDPLANEAILNASTNAVRQIGTNAIPFLLKKVASREWVFRGRVESLLERQSLIHFHFARPDYKNVLGMSGFIILGKDAKSAVPELIMLSKDPDDVARFFALDSLGAIESDKETLLPVLLRLLHDQRHLITYKSARLLSERFPEEAEQAGVYTNFPFLKPASSNIVPTNAPAVRAGQAGSPGSTEPHQ
jgi:hypothetical protein